MMLSFLQKSRDEDLHLRNFVSASVFFFLLKEASHLDPESRDNEGNQRLFVRIYHLEASMLSIYTLHRIHSDYMFSHFNA